MEVNSNNSEYIYTGVWTDWSHGRIHGATITLSAQNAGFLTAFLALFVSISAGHLWRIISFVVHQLHSSQKPTDALHHQQQVVFKNTTSPASLIWEFTLLAWAWRGRAQQPILRNLLYIVLAIIWLVITGSAAILSAKITKPAGSHCLIMSPHCGIYMAGGAESNTSDPNQLDTFDATQLLETNTATSYARACYEPDADRLPQCNSYAQPRLALHTTTNASCPFQSGMCLEGDTAAFAMDTGLLDSRDDLGINTPDDDRLFFRKFVSCAPLTRAGYVTVHNETNPLPGLPYSDYLDYWVAAYHYGSAFSGNGTQNYTYYYDTVTWRAQLGYKVQASWATAGSAGLWAPREELNRTDADVSLFFLNSNSVTYEYPTDDPMFSAHQSALSDLIAYGGNTSIAEFDNWYTADAVTTVLGCTDQFQFCNARTEGCSELQGIQAYVGVDKLLAFAETYNLSLLQTDIFGLLINYLSVNNIHNSIYGRPSYALRAQETLSGLSQTAQLPSNQWQIEVQSWVETNLASLQERSVQFATGPRGSREGKHRLALTDQTPLCKAQKVRCPAGRASFSVLGIACLLAVGGLIVLFNVALEPIMARVGSKWFPGSAYRRLNWALDDKLQLQRMAFEGARVGHWHGYTAAVPVTDKGEMFRAWADATDGYAPAEKGNNLDTSDDRASPLMGGEV
ncbi:hypothetical protein ATEIFO6365_0007049000 [Aspergillus terreus]|uniref:Uncharacterized protein n=1 Tax=Aspergillus terreus TaxID=33178 RepID=A0A5M3Z535_ASPTE|nr:hypothetical protein ATETN484_0009049000 [Aspergillus terreus]GFF17941.1 hypothetical protein ATEIFO6365_0007049000 [Aspergillus terreus]